MSFEDPPYWYCFAIASDDGPPEVAAIAPTVIDRSDYSSDVRALLTEVGRFHDTRPDRRVVFSGELTVWLHRQGRTWASMHVDLYEAFDELVLSTPTLLIQVNSIALGVVCDTALQESTIYLPDGRTESLSVHTEPVRAALTDVLLRDWPPFIRSLLAGAP